MRKRNSELLESALLAEQSTPLHIVPASSRHCFSFPGATQCTTTGNVTLNDSDQSSSLRNVTLNAVPGNGVQTDPSVSEAGYPHVPGMNQPNSLMHSVPLLQHHHPVMLSLNLPVAYPLAFQQPPVPPFGALAMANPLTQQAQFFHAPNVLNLAPAEGFVLGMNRNLIPVPVSHIGSVVAQRGAQQVIPSSLQAALQSSSPGIAPQPSVLPMTQLLQMPVTGIRNVGAGSASAGRVNAASVANQKIRSEPAQETHPSTTPVRTRLLHIPCDEDVLCQNQVMVRKQIEFFEAGEEHANTSISGRRKPVIVGQVGLQCRHCANLPIKRRQKGCVYFPARLNCIYQAAQNIASSHLTNNCDQIDPVVKDELIQYQKAGRTKGHAGKKYWAKTAEAQGLKENGGYLTFSAEE